MIAGRPGSGNGIVEVPDGLIHHWRGAAFLADATVDTALQLSRNYAQYSAVNGIGCVVAAAGAGRRHIPRAAAHQGTCRSRDLGCRYLLDRHLWPD